MSAPVSAGRKRRTLYDSALDTGAVLDAVGPYPVFPAKGGTNPPGDTVVFAGDFSGAHIHGFEAVTGAFVTLTTLGITIQQSHDGTNWHTYRALTGMAQNSIQEDMLDDADEMPMRYLRVLFAETAGTFGTAAGVKIYVIFSQVGAKGKLAPPGHRFKRD